MRYTFPSLKYVVLIFLIIGPFLAPSVYLLMAVPKNGLSNIPNPLLSLIVLVISNFMGVFLWWWGAFFDGHQGWQITILPTFLAAISHWIAMTAICRKAPILFQFKLIWFVSNILICAYISGIVFYTNALVFHIGGTEAPIVSELSKYGSTTLMFLTLTVSVIGAALGAILALISTSSPNLSVKQEQLKQASYFRR